MSDLDARKLRKSLKELTSYVKDFLVLLDHEMRKPSSVERGRRIGELARKLELKNDMVRRYTLELDFNGRPLKRKVATLTPRNGNEP